MRWRSTLSSFWTSMLSVKWVLGHPASKRPPSVQGETHPDPVRVKGDHHMWYSDAGHKVDVINVLLLSLG